LIIIGLPTLEKAFTKLAAGASFCRRSISDSLGPVKYCRTPLTGGAAAIGLVASRTVLPARLSTPARRIASSATRPSTASTRMSALAATSAKVASGMPFCALHSPSLLPSRLAIVTSWPCFLKPAASTLPTSPEPITPILLFFMAATLTGGVGFLSRGRFVWCMVLMHGVECGAQRGQTKS
jgi:hypothetical protein